MVHRTGRQARTAAALLSLLIILVAIPSAHAITYKVLAQSEECFSETVEAGGRIGISFEVTDGGKKDINANFYATIVDDGLHPEEDDAPAAGNYQGVRRHAPRVSVSAGHTLKREDLQQWTLVSEGEAQFQAKTAAESHHGLPSKVTICFDNKMSRWTPKWVDFNFVKMEVHKDAAAGAAPGAEQPDQAVLEHKLHAEGVKLFNMHGVMQKVRTREFEHRNVVESTNTWLLYGTIINGVLVTLMAVFQYWYLKTFLAVRTVAMRV